MLVHGRVVPGRLVLCFRLGVSPSLEVGSSPIGARPRVRSRRRGRPVFVGPALTSTPPSEVAHGLVAVRARHQPSGRVPLTLRSSPAPCVRRVRTVSVSPHGKRDGESGRSSGRRSSTGRRWGRRHSGGVGRGRRTPRGPRRPVGLRHQEGTRHHGVATEPSPWRVRPLVAQVRVRTAAEERRPQRRGRQSRTIRPEVLWECARR